MTTTSTQQITSAFEQNKWTKAQQLLLAELKIDPDNHWLLTRLATTYYEQKKYTIALRHSERAMEIMPECPLVCWDYACILDMLSRSQESIDVWKQLLEVGAKTLADDPCGEGIAWANSLINDCRYRVALASSDLSKYGSAKTYMRKYLDGLDQGVSSIYERMDAERKIEQWKGK